MAILSRRPHVGLLDSEPERILWNSRRPTADSTPTNEAYFVALFTWARRADDLWSNNHYVLPKRDVVDHVEDKPHNEVINGKEWMPRNESTNESGCFGPT